MDRNTLLAALAVSRGLAQRHQVVEASVAVSVDGSRSLTDELVSAGALTAARAQELEAAATQALAAAGGDFHRAVAASGAGPAGLADEDDEPTRIVPLDQATTVKARAPSLADDEDEPTRVLDWDRAARKSIERADDPPKPGKK